jgi:hypothetical protein
MWPVRVLYQWDGRVALPQKQTNSGFSAAGDVPGEFPLSEAGPPPNAASPGAIPFHLFCFSNWCGLPNAYILLGQEYLPSRTGSTRRESQRASLTKKSGSHHVRWRVTAYIPRAREAPSSPGQWIVLPGAQAGGLGAFRRPVCKKAMGNARHFAIDGGDEKKRDLCKRLGAEKSLHRLHHEQKTSRQRVMALTKVWRAWLFYCHGGDEARATRVHQGS